MDLTALANMSMTNQYSMCTTRRVILITYSSNALLLILMSIKSTVFRDCYKIMIQDLHVASKVRSWLACGYAVGTVPFKYNICAL